MPTGYTSLIEQGASFNEFVLRCARSMGALVEMRDDSMKAKIRLPKPSGYYKKRLAEAQRKASNLARKNIGEALKLAKKMAAKEYALAVQHHQDRLKEIDALRQRYESMLAEVIAWTPPTTDHNNLKKFMIEQITSTIEFDCTLLDEPRLRTPAQQLAFLLTDSERDLEFTAKSYEEELQRCRERSGWIEALVQSLNLAEDERKLYLAPKSESNTRKSPKNKKMLRRKATKRKSR